MKIKPNTRTGAERNRTELNGFTPGEPNGFERGGFSPRSPVRPGCSPFVR